MHRLARCLSVIVVALAMSTSSGCKSLNFMHPRNTWRLNRGPALDQGDAYFSISDSDTRVE